MFPFSLLKRERWPGVSKVRGLLSDTLCDREEFLAVTDPRTPDMELRLAEWQHYYDWIRPHGSLNGHTPIEAFCAKQEATPVWDEVEVMTRMVSNSRLLTTKQT